MEPLRLTVIRVCTQPSVTRYEGELNCTVVCGVGGGVGGGVGVGVGVGDGVGVGVGVGVAVAAQPASAAPQLPTTNSVPPRAMSRLPFTWLVNVWPRRPASRVPFPIAPFDANGFSLATDTLIVIVLFVVSNFPQSALPRVVLVNDPSEFLTVVPNVKLGEAGLSVFA